MHSSDDDQRSSDENYLPDDESEASDDYVLPAKHYSDNVFDDYTYSDMEYDTEDEQAPYRNTRSGQNSAPAEASSASGTQDPDTAPQNNTGSRPRNPDEAPNKRRRTGGYLPPKKPKDVKNPKVAKGTPQQPAPPDPTEPLMPDFQVKEEETSWEKQLLTPYVHAISYFLITPTPETLEREQEQELDSYAVTFFPRYSKEEDLKRLGALRRHIKRRLFLAARNACKYPPAVQPACAHTILYP